jgi:hypothetical protein
MVLLRRRKKKVKSTGDATPQRRSILTMTFRYSTDARIGLGAELGKEPGEYVWEPVMADHIRTIVNAEVTRLEARARKVKR